MSFPRALSCNDFLNAQSDALIVITSDIHNLGDERLNKAIAPYLAVDARIASKASLVLAEELPGKRLIVSPTGPLNRDYDDVRRVFDAAKSAITEAKAAGVTAPTLLVVGMPEDGRYENALEVAFLGMCQALWQPLEAREYRGESIEPVKEINLVGASEQQCQQLNALAAGQYAARDLCGTEPERMAPPKFADYCVELFKNTNVTTEVVSDLNVIEQNYPMLATVARASYAVERHHPRVVKLVYTPSDEVTRTLMFVGKGLVYDTGGADLKVGGFMAGMSRDKGGAASVAGFMKAVADYQPKGVKVIAYLAVVRNSIGSDCFVPDEIITCREGLKVRIGNTDAEGRLAMGDLLSEIKDLAKAEVNPELFTVATLTGHAARAVGPYSAYVENGPARMAKVSRQLADIGDLWADGAELSRSRREDYDFVKPRTLADDVLSSNNAPSAVTARGHQFPMAFLAIVGGLDKHGCDSELPIPYVHMDIAGSGVEGGDWQHGKPTAATVSSLFVRYCL
jgi:leucyl aminopeptidase